MLGMLSVAVNLCWTAHDMILSSTHNWYETETKVVWNKFLFQFCFNYTNENDNKLETILEPGM